MKIEYLKLKELKPYKNNPRINDDAVEAVKNSIKDFGFRNPILVDQNNEIIAGHTRAKAAKKLGLTEVPVIRIEDLTEEQIKAFRIADNSSGELAQWDLKKLEIELEDISFDMEDFGLKFDFSKEPIDYAVETQDRVENILGLGKGQFEGEGYYDIPVIYGIKEMPEVKEWIGFNYVMSDTDPEGKGVHFFVDDYQFERVWNDPERYVEKLKRYKAVLSPDFSPYGDMPLATQIWNHYRKHWCAAFWQLHGVTVIPTIRASTDSRSLDWYLDGEPRESVVAISTMWASEYPEEMRHEYERMVDALNPSHVIVYGSIQDYMDKDKVTCVQTFTEKFYKKGETDG